MGLSFVGQKQIISELTVLSNEIRSGNNLSIFITGPSGYGKTYLSDIFVYYIDPSLQSVQYLVAGPATCEEFFLPGKRIIVLDEVHTLENFEWLYPLIDRRDRSFFFLSNDYGNIPEAFTRRCIPQLLAPYSDEEFFQIMNLAFSTRKVDVPTEFQKIILSCTKKTPAKIFQMAERLSYIFKTTMFPTDTEELNEILFNFMGIKGGLDVMDRKYIETLQQLGGISGLERIVMNSRIPRQIILREIEPFLMDKKILEISSRGRKLCS